MRHIRVAVARSSSHVHPEWDNHVNCMWARWPPPTSRAFSEVVTHMLLLAKTVGYEFVRFQKRFLSGRVFRAANLPRPATGLTGGTKACATGDASRFESRKVKMSDSFIPYIARDRVVGPYKFDLHIEDPVAKEWYDSNPNQWQRERQWCMDTIRPGFNVLDCGAHQGLMTILFALCAGPAGVVHAWEVLPKNAALIERNVALNGCHNVIVHPRGIGSENARLPMNENQGNVVVLGQNSELATTGSIEIVRLDDDVDPSLRVNFLKIDVEGHDLHGLRGAPRILAQRPFLMLELHNFLFVDRKQTVTEIVKILTDLNYYIWVDDFTTAFDVGRAPDVEWLAGLKHAQLYCAPAS